MNRNKRGQTIKGILWDEIKVSFKRNKSFRTILGLILIIIGLIIFLSNRNVTNLGVQEEKNQAYVESIDGLNLRQEPQINSKIEAILPYGSKLTLLEKVDGWYRVGYQDKIGWSSANYLINEKPQELSVRDIEFSKLIGLESGVNSLLPIEYADYTGDGKEDALLTVLNEGSSEVKEYFVYGYQDGIVLKKYLDLRPSAMPEAFIQGFMGHDGLKFKDDSFVLSYPLYKAEDPNCCPTGGNKEVVLVWDGSKFVVKK